MTFVFSVETEPHSSMDVAITLEAQKASEALRTELETSWWLLDSFHEAAHPQSPQQQSAGQDVAAKRRTCSPSKEFTVPAQCPLSARSVPSTLFHSARFFFDLKKGPNVPLP